MSQAAFITATLDPAAPVPRGISDGQGRATTKRFNVYRNNVVVGLKDALGAGFPAVKSLVGNAFFDAMAGAFVRAHPPKSPVMPLYGAGFSAFIAAFPPAASLPYLADVARLEWAMRCAYHAADAPAIAPNRLTDPAAFAARITLAPAVHIVCSPYPILEVHSAAFGGTSPTGAAQDVMITRPQFDPVLQAFPKGTSAILTALNTGTPLGEALERAPHTLDLTAFIGALMSGGAITHLEDIA